MTCGIVTCGRVTAGKRLRLSVRNVGVLAGALEGALLVASGISAPPFGPVPLSAGAGFEAAVAAGALLSEGAALDSAPEPSLLAGWLEPLSLELFSVAPLSELPPSLDELPLSLDEPSLPPELPLSEEPLSEPPPLSASEPLSEPTLTPLSPPKSMSN
ncbi:MAG: hypothetical protein P0Y65_01285 [Candidatus Devosia phytovorans]|uniref:Uncharacterized protein n=1 Tax=Candidatus Devosia phytovorans TaxID=3121372 RepID=A0AAJ5VV50_9HYPH|nr:hypothetical protein [Devosia sp.]WEK04917.1 MAG: hypothetical protein P0Y65_01285 [Devosia sp.]